MSCEKLTQLEGWGYEHKDVKITMQDGTDILCRPHSWEYLDNGVAYTVKLLTPYGNNPAGSLIDIEEIDIKEQHVV